MSVLVTRATQNAYDRMVYQSFTLFHVIKCLKRLLVWRKAFCYRSLVYLPRARMMPVSVTVHVTYFDWFMYSVTNNVKYSKKWLNSNLFRSGKKNGVISTKIDAIFNEIFFNKVSWMTFLQKSELNYSRCHCIHAFATRAPSQFDALCER